MNHSLRVVYILATFICMHTLRAEPVITMFMKQYPVVDHAKTITDSVHAQKLSNDLKNPGTIAAHNVHGGLGKQMVSGIFSTYAGFLSTSNSNGQTFFPRRHLAPFVYFLVTEHITPILMAGNTIHHWELETKTPAALYKAERIQDPETQLWYWNIKEQELPADNIIPLEAITIFAKPVDVYIPTGITLTRNTTNMILPDIYIKRGIKIYAATLYVLNLRHFFGEMNFLYEKRPASYSSLLNP